MSAALTRAKELEHGPDEFTQPAETRISGNLETRPVIEVATVAGFDRSSISEHGMTPLMHAACNGSAGTVRALLDRGVEVNAKRSDDLNALALAAFFGHSQVVWLLLENGADLVATGRSCTLPETWADVRGFVDVGDILREARATKSVEAPNPSTVVDDTSHFARPAEEEELQTAKGSYSCVEASVIGEVTDSEDTLAIRPAPMAEPTTETEGEPIAAISPGDKPERTQEPFVIRQSLVTSRTLPEITDPPALVVPEFRPGSVFVARITSSRKSLVALVVAVWLICGGIAAFLVPQIRKSLADVRTDAVNKTTTFPAEPSNVVASETNVSGKEQAPPVATTESTTAPASRDPDQPAADSSAESQRVEESTSRVESAEVSGKVSPVVDASSGPGSRAHPSTSTYPGSRVADPSRHKRQFSAATSMSRSAVPARKQRATSEVVVKQETVAEEQPKPAPLSVVASRSRSVLSAPARGANEVSGSQPLPLGIISGKPKSKVIQWP